MQNLVQESAHRRSDTPGDLLDAFLRELLAQQSEEVRPAVPHVSVCRVYEKVRQERTSVARPAPAIMARCTSIPNDCENNLNPVDLPVSAEELSGIPGCDLLSPLLDAPPQTVTDAGCIYRAADLTLFERLTGYRLLQQGRVWRSIDGEGNRPPASDRLFTVLAEEAFGMADRRRRDRGQPDLDLAPADIATATGSLRSIAAHLDARVRRG
ncbi:hypothetical protein ACQKKX_20280 [Neorhizobium sp. NPDC001467]|uniref:hypothetical protein n=1 Tax=Neorhizobium sp. NPDC001467 TaxID=3390595 RepID=UPI003D04596C